MDALATRTRPRRRVPLTAAAALALLTAGAAPAGARPERPVDRPPPRLSDTGLYARRADRTIRPDNLPFSPQYPLWSDGASKRRWVHIPKGKWVNASRPDAWVFPPGTRFWKEFSFGRPVETRYLERRRDGSWLYATYVWTADGSDALLAPPAGVRDGHAIKPGVNHQIPGEADCRVCHEGKSTPVLGFDALQLSSDRDPLAPHAERRAAGELDLSALVARGLIRGLPARVLERPPRIAAASPRARAALGYLHANCGGCHNAGGPLAPLGMVLAHSGLSGDDQPAPALRTTAGQPPRTPLPGAGDADIRLVAPGRPDASAILLRMRSRHPLLQMPPLGTQLADSEAMALLERWIAEDLGINRKENAP